jgi:GNAT superfamily N-acetyltransferase
VGANKDRETPKDRTTLVWVNAEVPAGLARIELHRKDKLLGDLDYRACPNCAVAVLEQLRVAPEHRCHGLGRQLVTAVLAAYPEHDWSTTALAESATGFWDAIDWPGLRGDPHWCVHMHQIDEHGP